MKLYIAGQYSRREEFHEYATQLENCGMSITSRWLEEDKPLIHRLDQFDQEWLYKTALQDWMDIQRADAMLFFAEDSENQPRRGGRHVEFGIALASNKRIFVIGQRENLFHYSLSVKHYRTFEEFLHDAANQN